VGEGGNDEVGRTLSGEGGLIWRSGMGIGKGIGKGRGMG